jgi:hypothetical protein
MMQEFQESLDRGPAMLEDGRDHNFGMYGFHPRTSLSPVEPFYEVLLPRTQLTSPRLVSTRNDLRIQISDSSFGKMSPVAAKGTVQSPFIPCCSAGDLPLMPLVMLDALFWFQMRTTLYDAVRIDILDPGLDP